MIRLLALLVVGMPAVTLALAEDQSHGNNSQLSNSLEVEPPILKQNLSPERSATEAPGDAVARLEKKLEEAKRDTKAVERLCTAGVLSKVEMEQRLLQVIQCEVELASARLAEAKEKLGALQSAAASDKNAKDQLASGRAALQQLAEAAEAATAKRNRAELEAAAANLRRQQQLLKLGVAAKADVDRAEEKLAELQAQNHQ
jgi:multidrug resistance efflux pump